MYESLQYSTIDYSISAVIDSGSSELILPTQIYNLVITYLENCCDLTYYSSQYGYVMPTNDLIYLPTIDFLYGGYWMEVSVEDYMYSFSTTYSRIMIADSG